MSIQYFEPRPPKVAALQLDPEWSVGERIEKLRDFPGVKRVTVSASGSDTTRYTLTLSGGAEPLDFYQDTAWWLVAVLSQTVDDCGWICRTVDVKLVSAETLHSVYRPIDYIPAQSADSDVCADRS